MTPAAIIDALIAAGTPAKLVVEVARIFQRFETEAEVLATAREKNRIRQQNQRLRNVTSRDVTLQIEKPTISTIASRDEQKRHILKKEESKKERIKKVSARKISLPEDFTLNETDRAACRDEAWTPEKRETELMRFKDDAHAHGRKYIDWHAAWRKWVRSPFQSKSTGGMNGHHHETVADKGKRLIANMDAAMRSQAGSAGGDEGGDQNVISLPRQQGRLF